MRTWLGLVLLAAASPVAGQERLTLSDAVESALRSHPSVTAAEAAVARADAGVRENAASRLPAASLDGSATRHQEPMLVAPLHGFDLQSLPQFDPTLVQAALTVGYTAFDGGARGWRGERALHQRDAALAAAAGVRGALMQEAARRYTDVVTLREQVTAANARVAALERELERAARLLAEGRAARVVPLRAEAALSAARAEQAGLAASLGAAHRELARVTGMEASFVERAALRVATSAPGVPERESVFAAARATSAELVRLRAQHDAARAAAGVASSQKWPTVQLGGRYVRFGSGAGDAGGEWQAGMQLSYTIFSAGARPAAVERAAAEVRQATAEVALGELRVAAQVDAALAQLDAARARSEAWRDAVTQSAEVARIEKLALDAGAGVQSEYLTAEADLLRARAALAEAQAAVLNGHVEIARLTGELSPAWLARNLESGS